MHKSNPYNHGWCLSTYRTNTNSCFKTWWTVKTRVRCAIPKRR